MAQSFSLHPAWDRMYLSGMTVREITDYTGAPRSTVQRHLKKRGELVGDFQAVHDAANHARGKDWPGARWRHSYKAVQDFHKEHGHLPTSGLLARWVGTQRSLHRAGNLPPIKFTLMGQLPGWDQTPARHALDDAWWERLAQLEAFMIEHGALPRYKNHASELEHTLGVWLHTQHQRRHEGTLLQWRLEALNSAVPEWRSRA